MPDGIGEPLSWRWPPSASSWHRRKGLWWAAPGTSTGRLVGTQVLRQDLSDSRSFRQLQSLLVRGPDGSTDAAPMEAARAAVKRLLNSRAEPMRRVDGQPR